MLLQGLTSGNAQNPNSVTLAWDASLGDEAVTYRLYVGGASGVYTNTVDCGTNLEGTVTDLAEGGTYFFVVCAVDSIGLESEPSNEVSYTVRETGSLVAEGAVTNVVLGTPRNNFSGYVGLQFKVGSLPLTVTSLGRYALEGNSRTHLLKFMRVSDGVDVPGGGATVNMSGAAPGTFIYEPLPSPITLQADTTYFLLSQEADGGDAWHNSDAVVFTTPDLAVKSGAWANLWGRVNAYGGSNQCFGPLDFTYHPVTNSVSGEMVVAQSLGTLRNNFTGWVGAKIEAGGMPVIVNALGRYMSADNTRTHSVKLVDAVTGKDIPGGAISISMSGRTVGQYAYEPLIAPITLLPGTACYLLSSEESRGDTWYNVDTTLTVSGALDILSGAWGYGFGSWYELGGAGSSYGPVNMKFSLGEAVSQPPALTNTTGGFITEVSLGRLRNDFKGYVGMRIEVADAPISVTDLGRFALAGNSGAHLVKLVRASDGRDLPGASVTVSMGDAAAGSFKYSQLTNPVVLEARKAYYVVSLETKSGDAWYDDDTILATTEAAVITSGVWSGPQSDAYVLSKVGKAYGPVNFKYSIATNSPESQLGNLISGHVLGSTKNDFNGWVGVSFKVGDSPLLVNALGRIAGPASKDVHMLKLVQASDGADIAGSAVSVNMSGAKEGDYVFGTLEKQLTLSPGSIYYALSSETVDGDPWYNIDTVVTSGPAATVEGGAWGFGDDEWFEYGPAGSCYGPVNVRFATAANPGPAAAASFITDTNLGRVRNDFSGWVGMRFEVGPSPLTVSHLGRYISAGNTGSHPLKLVRAADGADVPGSAVVVDAKIGTPGEFAYTQLDTPISLAAGASYLLVGLEARNGDAWYDADSTLSSTPVAKILSAAWGASPGGWYVFGGAGQSYGPLDFKYSATNPPAAFLSAQTPGRVRNDFKGWVGMSLEVGPKPMIVNSLGRFKVAGNACSHSLKIVRADNGCDVAGSLVTVTMTGGTPGRYVFADLSAPVTLEAGATYHVLSAETKNGDEWHDIDTAVTSTGAGFVKRGAWAYETGPIFSYGAAGNCYGPVNLRYTVGD